MLELKDISLKSRDGAEDRSLIVEASARFPEGHFCAVLGPSGSGKSTLLKLIAGLKEASSGGVTWRGRDLSTEGDLAPHEIGYVPQFSIAYDYLTVKESVENALELRVGGLSLDERDIRVARLLEGVGIYEIADRQVRVLSGGERRRLALAMELTSSPVLLLCDEVTSGLDPKAEDEIVHLLKRLSREQGRIVLSVTHSLRHAELYDSIFVLHEGHTVFHGAPEFLRHYFSLDRLHELFPRLTQRPAEDWHRSWRKHRGAYYATQHDVYQAVSKAEDDAPASVTYEQLKDVQKKADKKLSRGETMKITVPIEEHKAPGVFAQIATLLVRRWRLFTRDTNQMFLHLALLFGFPVLVVIFAWNGLPELKNMDPRGAEDIVRQVIEDASFRANVAKVGGLASGLVMFQVILLTLMGANNTAREIAGERLIYEKEKFAGLLPSAYITSKVLFYGLLVLVQSAWMGVFVNAICRFPGDPATQVAILTLVNGAMTATCLAISSYARSADQASLLGVYLVGFQLPLSGAVLALPQFLGWITRPFIAAYWGWSGFLQTFRESRFYEAATKVTDTPASALALCLWVLGCHVVIGIFIAYTGSRTSRWD